ncbi:hypothetical protein AGABI2DRAFT_178657 [Agaricus bisporus var. bisporus H97]|uniref:hypothetical protein n=1 Tax=Agaricus bisporus var. bisporus (strain H97 / ATCC MYA-4626 / FGSC 10389) TaxID=936046 RepID=UPI00029F6620|nr:hypothetical protein AGABI2DRAFT_178657 [Agaricus bisporus var. bisporus H97]EKV46221.1 hypothetical protein AGABI2DRAFT_178657 [Agaricus bisporus var. bisporus H97]
MPITLSIPSTFTCSKGLQSTRRLPPLPICGDSELLAPAFPSTHAGDIRPLPPLPVIRDDQIPAPILPEELNRPLSPPPMYGEETPTNSHSFTPLTRSSSPLPIHDEEKPIVSSTLSMPTGPIRPLPSLPVSCDKPIPVLKVSTAISRARPLPALPHESIASMRPLPPLPDSFFTDAQNFVLNHANFTETVNHIHNTSSKERTIFDLLEPYTMLDATKDSGARYPPPQCHPKTRLNIKTKLANWLYDEKHEWKVFYICGFAGTGKSAIAQSFADSCDEWKKLGGAYFFSRMAGSDKLETVVPTLAYQLAISVPEYKSILTAELANDPLLLRSSPPVQFKRLIVQPFSTLQRQRHRDTLVIILDGLDECEGRRAQLMILEMISGSLHTTPGLPLRWLIFSRPEAHLKYKFLGLAGCGYEELVVDAECRDDVELFVRERIADIKVTYDDIIPRGWPSQDELRKLLDEASGNFEVASASLDEFAALLNARLDAFSKLTLYAA